MYQYQRQTTEESSEETYVSDSRSVSAPQHSMNQSSAFPSGTLLRKGSTGSLVKQMQQALLQLGMQLVVDGVFGPQTEKIVRLFQRIQRLDIDGVAGSITLARLSQLSGGRPVKVPYETWDDTNRCFSTAPTTGTQYVEHRVFSGDSLWTIAAQHLGNGMRWREIARANGLSEASH